MDSTIRPSESLPSSHSFRSYRLSTSSYESSHILAYLCRDSARSIGTLSSRGAHGRGGSPPDTPGGQISGNEVWWNAFMNSEPLALRPLSEFGTSPVTESTPGPTGSHSRTGHTRRRPPALKLDAISNEARSHGTISGSIASPAFSLEECETDRRSPWNVLKDFPSPPSTPPVIQGSRTSRSLSKILRRGGNVPSVPVPTPGTPKHGRKERSAQQDENIPPTPRLLKKGHASLGSLGRAFRTTHSPVPSTPPPIPASWTRLDQSSNKVTHGAKALNNSHRRDTFKSKLFSLAASPKAGDGSDRKASTPIRPSPHYIPRREIRAASSPSGMATAQGNARHNKSRSRSVSQPTQTKTKRNKTEPGIPEMDSAQWVGHIDVRKQLVIPERRTRSPSYINLYVPPWRQANLSPTQTSFASVGGVMSAPTTPTNAAFELLPDEVMHLPASGSVRSLRAEVDPFGAGEPVSFFRSEYGRNWDARVAVDQDVLNFYRVIGVDFAASRGRRGRRPKGPSSKPHRVPEIVISSSTGLEGLKERNWVLTD